LLFSSLSLSTFIHISSSPGKNKKRGRSNPIIIAPLTFSRFSQVKKKRRRRFFFSSHEKIFSRWSLLWSESNINLASLPLLICFDCIPKPKIEGAVCGGGGGDDK
jgi:hypothetical protein